MNVNIIQGGRNYDPLQGQWEATSMLTILLILALLMPGKENMPLYVAASTSEVVVLSAETRALHSKGYLRRYFIGRDFKVHEHNVDINIDETTRGGFLLRRSDGKTCAGRMVESEPRGGLRIKCIGWTHDQLLMPVDESTLNDLLKFLHQEASRQQNS